NVLAALCKLAAAPAGQSEAEMHAAVLDDHVTLCEHVFGYSLVDRGDAFDLVVALRARAAWDPRDRNTLAKPALVVDSETGRRYVRAGELRDYFTFRGAGIDARAFEGRMMMLGLARTPVNGRERATVAGQRRRTNR